jgi:multiple sugar transport system permease protein
MQAITALLRVVFGGAAALVVLLSFYWVATRPMRVAETNSDQTGITLVHWGDDTEDAIVAGLVDAFHKAHPDFHVQRINPGNAPDVTRKIQTMIASGAPPDVFYLGYENVSGWASQGLLEPLEPFIERDRQKHDPEALTLSNFFTNVLACFRYDDQQGVTGEGVLYGMPKDFTTVGFYYNKDLLRKAGVPDPPPEGWTWDEFLHACREIGKLPNCFGADFATWEPMLRVYCWTQGAEITSDGFRTYDFTDPKVAAALRQLEDWFNEGRTLASAKTQIETSSDPFLSGRIGMAGPFGRWKAPVYRLIEDFDWDFAPMPHSAGRAPANGIFTTAWAMSSASDRKDAAWTLIRFLSGEPGQRMISETGLAIPSMISVAESDAFTDPSIKPYNDRVYLDAVPYARPIAWPPDPRFMHAFRIRMEEVFKIGSKTPSEALAAIQHDWDEFRASDVRGKDYAPVPWGAITIGLAIPVALLLIVGGMQWWRKRPTRMAFEEEVAGLTMISPWVLGFCAFTAFPIVVSLLLSFSKWSGLATLGHAEWVGLDNFRQMFHDARFLKSLWITALYAALAVPAGQLLALLAAVLMNSEIKGIYFFRAAWYLPSVLAGVAISILWSSVFHHEHGLLNALLAPFTDAINSVGGWFGREWHVVPPRWFERDAESWGVPAFAIMSFWTVGGPMMIYLAGLKGIPAELYEAASIDGARRFASFRNVTLPMLSPVIFFNGIMAIIASFQIFTQVYVITGGGPGDATKFYVVNLYSEAFDLHQMGYASAMAWLLLLIVLGLTLFVMWGSKRYVYYEALK